LAQKRLWSRLCCRSFFAYSGLRTQIGFELNYGYFCTGCVSGDCRLAPIWQLASLASKPGSLSTGLVDEYRGLTELIVLNIGLSLGVISPLLFTMLVMALVTTFMTSLLEWTYPKNLIKLDMVESSEEEQV